MINKNKSKSEDLVIYSELIDATKDITSAAILTDLVKREIELTSESNESQINQLWNCRLDFRWDTKLNASMKKIDSRIRQLKKLGLIESKLFKINGAPLLHLRIKRENRQIQAILNSREEEKETLELDFPISSKSPPWDFPIMEESYSNSRSIKYTPTKAIGKAIQDPLAKRSNELKKKILSDLEKNSLAWEKKEPELSANFSPEEILILSYLEECPLNVEQKMQLFAFSPADVLQAVKRTKQSKIKKTFMHCLMHACIHKLGPYIAPEQLEEAYQQERECEIQKNKELALTIEKLVEGTFLQGCLKSHEYHIYYDLSFFDSKNTTSQNLAYLDQEFPSVINGIYKLCVNRLSRVESYKTTSHLSLNKEETSKKINNTVKEKKYSKNFRVCV